MSDIATFAPIQVSIKFSISNGDQVAQANFDCPPGEIPTEEQVKEAAQNVLRQVQEQLGEEFVWQERVCFVQDLFEERTGRRGFAVPGRNEWQADWANAENKALTKGTTT